MINLKNNSFNNNIDNSTNNTAKKNSNNLNSLVTSICYIAVGGVVYKALEYIYYKTFIYKIETKRSKYFELLKCSLYNNKICIESNEYSLVTNVEYNKFIKAFKDFPIVKAWYIANINKVNFNTNNFLNLKINKPSTSILEYTCNTPIIKSNYLSNLTGLNVYIKLENLLPYTSKDRITKNIIFQAVLRGDITKNTTLYEGSSGSTCYSVAMIGNILGLKSKLVIPDDLSEEKLNLLKSTGAELIITKQCPYSNFNDNYIRLAKKLASNDKNGFLVNQFENEDNFKVHFYDTSEEILNFFYLDNYKYNINKLDAFVSGAGTGGTIAGISNRLKQFDSNIKVYLADVTGSGLYSYVKNNVVFTQEESEANRKKYRYYTKIEGIGINFLTSNFKRAIIDDAVKITDDEAIDIAKKVYINDGLFAGGSSGVNFAAIVKLKDSLPRGSNVLTIMYDSGYKYLKKLYSNEVK